MKKAKEWQDMWIGSPWVVPDGDQIQAIQSDAYKAGLLRAAQVCKDIASQLGRADDHWIIERAQRDIESESHKEAIKEAK